KPAEVLPQHKRRAVTLFIVLIVAILAYSGLLVYNAVKKSKNPSTSFVLSNNVYRYPDTYVCLYNYFGCDDMDLEEFCVSSVFDTEGGRSSAVFNPGGDLEQEIATTAYLTDERGWCVSFETSAVDIVDGERDPEDYILLDMYWYPGGNASASTTCISEEGEWESHSESVFVFLRDSDTGILSAGIQVAYSCMTNESSSHVFTYMGIGLTKEDKLNEEDTASYKALETSSALYKDKRTDNITGITSPYAWLSMEIAQSTDSLEEITEINPLEIAELFGNVGGFWDLLLMLWPIFFISASRQDPHLKVRNFKKSVTRGSERVVDLSRRVNNASLEIPHPLRRQPGSRQSNATGEDGEPPPAWESGGVVPAYRQQVGSSRRVSRESVPHSSHRRYGSTPATAVPPPGSSARSMSLGAVTSTSMSPSARLGQSETFLLKDSPRRASRGPLSSAATVPGVGVLGWSGGGRGGGSGGRHLSRDGCSAPLTN
ncbi:unnamed protein product, partial [Ectocarpus fasciculatus]